MATRKTGTKAATKKTTAKATTTPREKTKVATARATTRKVSTNLTTKSTNEPNYPAIILAEIVGTFILTMVALAGIQQTGSLYVGLTLAVLVLIVGAISGSHLNPAVTFGLWAARKVKTALVPVYWVAQFVGAIIAILILGALSGNGYPLDFGHFGDIHWGVIAAEGVGAAVFLFGFTALYSNETVSKLTKAFGIGFALTLGLVVSATALTTVQTAKYNDFQAERAAAQDVETSTTIPAELHIKGATLNPAISLAATEYTESQLNSMPSSENETMYSRLDLNTIIGTLVGAALGANAYLLLAYAQRNNRYL